MNLSSACIIGGMPKFAHVWKITSSTSRGDAPPHAFIVMRPIVSAPLPAENGTTSRTGLPGQL